MLDAKFFSALCLNLSLKNSEQRISSEWKILYIFLLKSLQLFYEDSNLTTHEISVLIWFCNFENVTIMDTAYSSDQN